MKNNQSIGKALALLFSVSLLALTACQSDNPATEAEFCAVLSDINTRDLPVEKHYQVQGHAEVIAMLLPVAPAEIKDKLEALHALFERWGSTGDSVIGTFLLFADLSDPELAALEGDIADYMITTCELDLPTKVAHVVVDEESDPICPAWPRLGSPISNNRFPNYLDTSGGNYFANQFWSMPLIPSPPGFIDVPRGGSVVFRGDYPRARYFAYHPNDKSTNNLPTLVDVDIEPDAGSVNPYRQVAKPEDKTRYTVRYIFDEPPNTLAEKMPEKSQANTRYVGVSKSGGYNPLVMNLLRLYASDIGNSANSGGVKLPAVTVYDAAGQEVEHYPECDPYPNGPETAQKETTLFPVMPLPDHRAVYPVKWGVASQFNLPVDILSNADAQYFNTAFSQRLGELYVLRAKALTVPDTRNGESVSTQGKDVRFWTICNYNFWAGRAGTCLLDSEIPIDQQGYYTIVVSPERYRPHSLGDRSDIWMDWGDYLDTQISYRTGLRHNEKLVQISKALQGETVAPWVTPYVPMAVPCSKSLYEQGGWQACWSAKKLSLEH